MVRLDWLPSQVLKVARTLAWGVNCQRAGPPESAPAVGVAELPAHHPGLCYVKPLAANGAPSAVQKVLDPALALLTTVDETDGPIP